MYTEDEHDAARHAREEGVRFLNSILTEFDYPIGEEISTGGGCTAYEILLPGKGTLSLTGDSNVPEFPYVTVEGSIGGDVFLCANLFHSDGEWDDSPETWTGFTEDELTAIRWDDVERIVGGIIDADGLRSCDRIARGIVARIGDAPLFEDETTTRSDRAMVTITRGVPAGEIRSILITELGDNK